MAAAAPYDVVIGNNLLGELPGLLGDGVQRVAVVHPRALRSTGDAIRDDLTKAGYTAHAIEIPDARWCLGVQWHPEMGKDPRLFRALVEAAEMHYAERTVSSLPPLLAGA